MAAKRSGLLVLLILASLVAAGVGTTASAREKRVTVASLERGGMAGPRVVDRASGEPDVGGTPRTSGGNPDTVVKGPSKSSLSSLLPPCVRLALMTWSVWFPGLR